LAEPHAFPLRRVTFGIGAMILLLSILTVLTWRIGHQIRSTMQSQIEVLTTSERLAHYGDVLELSIKSVVAHGDQSAARRYRAVQPELRRTLNKLRNTVQLDQNRAAARQMNRIDLALIAREYQALELVNEGKIDAARALINSEQYDHLVGAYRQGIEGIEERSRAYVQSTQEELRWYLRATLVLSLAAFLLIGLAWFLLVRPARSWGRQLNAARARAEEAARRLTEQKAELKLLNRKLFDQARIDPLTKLNTRLRLSEDLQVLAARIERYSERYCAVMCDVDHFKAYNDTYGHPAGDEVLRKVAGALAESCRGGDQVYRYGGEEFLIIMPGDSLEGAGRGAERHRAAIEALQIPHSGSPLGIVTVSMGLAVIESGGPEAVEAWLEEADAALYRAKRAGRNRVAVAGSVAALAEAPKGKRAAGL
jgi:diguanylate cyclase (GGDEF)-like protein